MKQYNKFIILNCLLFLIIFVCINAVFSVNMNDKTSKGYVVEIGRIMHQFDAKSFNEADLLNEYNCEFVTSIDFIDVNATAIDTRKFFEGNGLKSSQTFSTRAVFDENNLVGYLRFSYIQKNNQIFNVQIILNISLVVIFLFFLAVLFYIRNTILKPFNSINDLPYKLSKGHLSDSLPESKSKFFGKFVWGLDLLRENLESHKKRELQLEKEKKMMILSISHDIKTPLSAIKLYSKSLYEKLYEDEEKQMIIAKNIENKVTQIEGFVSEIVKMSTTEIFDIQVQIDDFYLKNLVDKIYESYSGKFKILKTDFIINSYSNKLVSGDIDRLIEVVENVIENAIKYGDGKSIEVSFSSEEYCQLITITSSGCGLSSTEMVHIFESFWRGSNAQDKKGSGLGLYICKHIMHKMNGEIFATNNENSISLTIVVKES